MTVRRRSRRGDAAQRRHVVIIVQNLPVPLDRRVWLEAQELITAGYDVSVICPKGPGDPAEEVLEGVRLYKYDPPSGDHGVVAYLREFLVCWLKTAALLARIRRRGRIDAIQACNPPDTYFALAAPFKLLGTKFVFDHHDLCPEVYRSRFDRDRGLLLRGLYLLERWTFRTADHVISTNDSYRAVALERGRRRPGDITVVRSGPDLTRLRPVAPDASLRKGRRHLCAYVGVMGPQDGVDHALHAVATYVHEFGRTDCQFAFVGFGDQVPGLRRLADELGITSYVDFPGRRTGDDLFRYLATADVGLSPDPLNPLNDVSTMNKTLEYMAFGLPVVAFDLVETRTCAGDAAVYVNPNDTKAYAKAIAALLDDPGGRAEMAERGARRIRDALAWHHQAPQYRAVYDRLLRAGNHVTEPWAP